jgi:uncharacterized protein with HEPN domain
MMAAMERLAELTGRISRDAFDSDWVLQDAVMRELEILGEAAGRVSPSFTRAHPEIPWKQVTGIRHKLIHDYFEVDLEVVWETATVNVPGILPMVRAAVSSLTK